MVAAQTLAWLTLGDGLVIPHLSLQQPPPSQHHPLVQLLSPPPGWQAPRQRTASWNRSSPEVAAPCRATGWPTGSMKLVLINKIHIFTSIRSDYRAFWVTRAPQSVWHLLQERITFFLVVKTRLWSFGRCITTVMVRRMWSPGWRTTTIESRCSMLDSWRLHRR